jgi:hypothetical protein
MLFDAAQHPGQIAMSRPHAVHADEPLLCHGSVVQNTDHIGVPARHRVRGLQPLYHIQVCVHNLITANPLRRASKSASPVQTTGHTACISDLAMQ